MDSSELFFLKSSTSHSWCVGRRVRLKCGSGCGTERMGLKCGTEGVKMRNGTDGVKKRNGTERVKMRNGTDGVKMRNGTDMGLKCILTPYPFRSAF